MKQTLITLLFFFTGFTVLAQVGIGTQTPQATLDITGNQGLLIPRMTDHTVLTPIDGTLDANEKGLQVYNTTTNTIMVWDGVSWNGISGSIGPQGYSMLQGAGIPATSLGVIGDLYLDTDTTKLYEKTGATTWTLQKKLIEMQYTAGRNYNIGDLIINTDVNGVMTQYAVITAFTATNFVSDLSHLQQTNRFSMTTEIYTTGNSYTTGQWVVDGSSVYYANKNITNAPVTLNTADFDQLNTITPSMLNLTDTDLTTTPAVIGDLLMYDGVNWIPMPDQ